MCLKDDIVEHFLLLLIVRVLSFSKNSSNFLLVFVVHLTFWLVHSSTFFWYIKHLHKERDSCSVLFFVLCYWRITTNLNSFSLHIQRRSGNVMVNCPNNSLILVVSIWTWIVTRNLNVDFQSRQVLVWLVLHDLSVLPPNITIGLF